jgi:hypothetical protein
MAIEILPLTSGSAATAFMFASINRDLDLSFQTSKIVMCSSNVLPMVNVLKSRWARFENLSL